MSFRRQFTSNLRFPQLLIPLVLLALFIILHNNYYSIRIHTEEHRKSSNEFHDILQYTLTPRIFCFILTTPKYLLTRTKAVNDTWAPRCDRYFFVTEPLPDNATLDELNFAKQISIAPLKNLTPGYDHLTQKTNLALLFAYENYFNDCDWFVKADDDTYLFVDHLKMFLSDKNISEPITYGYNFKVFVERGYHSGGGSYVLSRESLRRFYAAHQDPASKCQKDGGSEDFEIAKCLRTMGVYPGKSLDRQNRELFHPLSFEHHFHGSFPDWLLAYAENPPQKHYNCCSDHTISFHYVPPEQQYMIDFLVYRTAGKMSNMQ